MPATEGGTGGAERDLDPEIADWGKWVLQTTCGALYEGLLAGFDPEDLASELLCSADWFALPMDVIPGETEVWRAIVGFVDRAISLSLQAINNHITRKPELTVLWPMT